MEILQLSQVPSLVQAKTFTRGEWAEYYARAGIKIFPCHSIRYGKCTCDNPECKSPGKHPIAECVRNGVKGATNKPEKVKRWWAAYSYANIALPLDGMLVVDIDPRNGGFDTFKTLKERYGRFDPAWVTRTQSGGLHLFFAWPNLVRTVGSLGPGIDIKRGPNAYVIGAPSIGIQRRYGPQKARGFIVPPDADYDDWRLDYRGPPGPPPQWLADLLKPASHARNSSGAGTPLDIEWEHFEAAVRSIPNERGDNTATLANGETVDLDSRPPWLSVLGGIKHQGAACGREDDALELAREFSERWDGHDDEKFEAAYDSLKPDKPGGSTGRTVLALAQSYNWKNPSKGSPMGSNVVHLFDKVTDHSAEAFVAAEASDELQHNDDVFDFVDPYDIQSVGGAIGGLRDTILDQASQSANPNFALASGVMVASTLCARHVVSPTQCALNLYTILCGTTGSGKDWPIKAYRAAMSDLGYGWLVSGSYASAQALEAGLVDRPCQTSRIDEIGSAAFRKFIGSKSSNHEAQLGGLKRELWSKNQDALDLSSALTRKNAVRSIEAPYYGIFGASTPAALVSSVGGEGIENGFLNRLTLVPSSEKNVPKGGNANARFTIPDPVRERLLAILPDSAPDCFKGTTFVDPPHRVPWDAPDVEQAYEAFKSELDARRAGRTGIEDLLSRTAEQAIRLATLCALSRAGRDDARVTMDDWRWGMAFAVTCARHTIELVGSLLAESPYQKRCKEVMDAIRKLHKPTDRRPAKDDMSATDIYRALDHKYGSRDLAEAIEGLATAGDIVVTRSQKSKNGTTVKFYRAAKIPPMTQKGIKS